MSSLAKKFEPVFVATDVEFTEDSICLQLADGREVKTPLDFYPILKNATAAQRKKFKLIGLGTGIHWEDLNEDMSVEGIVLGRPSFSVLPGKSPA
jgi:chaperone required for assembly of F1-ATPase